MKITLEEFEKTEWSWERLNPKQEWGLPSSSEQPTGPELAEEGEAEGCQEAKSPRSGYMGGEW